MFIFGLHSTSDDWLGWSMDLNPIHKPSLTPKNEMLIFGLCLTSDDQLSNPGDESGPKCKTKWPPNCQKMKCSFLDYVQLLIIS